MEGHINSDYGKMGMGVVRYLSNPIACIIDSAYAGQRCKKVFKVDRDIPIVPTLKDALKLKTDVLILGISPSGGMLPKSWEKIIISALDSGLSIVNGLHVLLEKRYSKYISNPEKSWIWDVRVPQFTPPIASAKAQQIGNKRVLFVGTDMAVGKMTSALEIYGWLKDKNVRVGFLATGQIGITVTGSGIPLDAFKVDHACGAVEQEILKYHNCDIILIEGQGSLLHPGSTATLPLMRGSCPTHLILCHKLGQDSLRDLPSIKFPDLKKFIRLNEKLAKACGSYPKANVIGVCLNSNQVSENVIVETIDQLESSLRIPVTDPIRFGPEKLGNLLLES